MSSLECLRDCTAACCREGTVFRYIVDQQVAAMRQAGGELKRLKAEEGFGWQLTEDCIYLNPDDHSCRVAELRELRPADCYLLEPGDSQCQLHRRLAGYIASHPPST